MAVNPPATHPATHPPCMCRKSAYDALPTVDEGKSGSPTKLKQEGEANGSADHSKDTLSEIEPPPGKRYTCSNQASVGFISDVVNSSAVRCMVFDLNAIYAQRATLKFMAEFGTLMLWYYLCDRTSIFPESGKVRGWPRSRWIQVRSRFQGCRASGSPSPWALLWVVSSSSNGVQVEVYPCPSV